MPESLQLSILQTAILRGSMKRIAFLCIPILIMSSAAFAKGSPENFWSLVGVISSFQGDSIAVVKNRQSKSLLYLKQGAGAGEQTPTFLRVLDRNHVEVLWRGRRLALAHDGSSSAGRMVMDQLDSLPEFEESPDADVTNLPLWKTKDLLKGVQWDKDPFAEE